MKNLPSFEELSLWRTNQERKSTSVKNLREFFILWFDRKTNFLEFEVVHRTSLSNAWYSLAVRYSHHQKTLPENARGFMVLNFAEFLELCKVE